MSRHKYPRHSVFRDIVNQPYDEYTRYRLFKSVKGSQDWVQRLGLLNALPLHSGCVNCICWNDKGDKLLSGSDDQHLIITDPYSYEIKCDYRTNHRANIFSAKFLPCTGDTGIVSCSGDGMILHSDLTRLEDTHHNIFGCHVGTTYEIATIPDDSNSFLSCGEDCTVRCFDLRTKQRCSKVRCLEDVIILCQRAVTAVVVNAMNPFQLAIGCSDSTVRLYDRRMLGIGCGNGAKPFSSYMAPGMEGRTYRITSLSFSPSGEEILVSYSSEHLYLFGIKNKETVTLSTENISKYASEDYASDERYLRGQPVMPVRRLRLRGDWSDTGPDARPQNESLSGRASQARPTLHSTLMQRMTDVLSRMLNDPATRAALSQGGEDSYQETEENQSSQSEPNTQAGDTQESIPSIPPLNEENSSGVASVDMNESANTIDSPENITETDDMACSSTPKENTPLDLTLPSFKSTYSSFVKQPTEEALPGSTEMEAQPQEPPHEPMQECAEGPSTSSGPPPAKKEKHSSMCPLNELSTTYERFVEKHGKKPMVNLMYSNVGPTTSCISVFLRDEEVPRNSPSPEKSSQEDSEIPQEDDSPQGDDNSQPLETSPAQEALEAAAIETEDEPIEGEYIESDEDSSPIMSTRNRLIHPIEKDMEEAIRNARGDLQEDCHYESCKTRKSYFRQKYTGHRNARTMIKEATFWGDNYVISGSDCGHVFMWEKDTARLKMLLEADQHVVNCVQPHPYLPILATSGIDYDVKLWAPVNEQPSFDNNMAEELMKRNAIMLEETKDTITVPASFMIRMLACLNQLRRGRGRHQRHGSSANSD